MPALFAWAVPDGDSAAGSLWRYELAAGPEPGSTVVRHVFTHGPGAGGARSEAEAAP